MRPNQTALPLTSNQDCGGVPGSEIPNHTFGHGRLDGWSAYVDAPYQLDLNLAAPATVHAGQRLTYTIDARWWHTTDPGHQLVVTDVIPAGTTFVSASPTYTLSADTVTWSHPQLLPGATFSATLAVQFAQFG